MSSLAALTKVALHEPYPRELLDLPDAVLRGKLEEVGIFVEGDRSALLEAIKINIVRLKQFYAKLPWLSVEVIHKYNAPIEVANAPANKPKDARGVDFKFSVQQAAGAPILPVLHGCLLVQTDAGIDGIDPEPDIWPQLNQMAPAELAYCWDESRRARYFNYVADEAGRPGGLAGHETNMKTDHPFSTPPAPDDPEINSLLSKQQGSWKHKEGQTVCLRVFPPTVVTGATQRKNGGNMFGGRLFRGLFYAEDRVAYPELICVTEPFPVRARATIDRARQKAREAAVANGLEIGTVEHQAFVQKMLTHVPAIYGGKKMRLGPTVPPSACKDPLNVLADAATLITTPLQ